MWKLTNLSQPKNPQSMGLTRLTFQIEEKFVSTPQNIDICQVININPLYKHFPTFINKFSSQKCVLSSSNVPYLCAQNDENLPN